MKTRRRIALPALAVTVLLGASACADPAPRPAAATPAAFGGTDLAWIEVTIALDEQLLPLLALVPQRAGDPAVKALATTVAGFTGGELTALRTLHDSAGLPAKNPHEGMPMPGMVTASRLTTAATLSGAAFDRLAAETIRESLEQGRNLAESEQKHGVEARTRALAADAAAARTRTLSSLGD